jgi:hypothetical protein
MADNARKTQEGIGRRTRDIADNVSTNRGEAPTGQATQQDITERWKPKFDALYDRMDAAVTDKVGDARVPIDNTLGVTKSLTAGIPGAPTVSRMLIGKSIPALDNALKSDAGIPASQITKALATAKQEAIAARAAYEQAATLNTDTLKANDFYPVPGMPRIPGRLSPFPPEAQQGAISALEAVRAADAKVAALQSALEGAGPTLPYPALRGVGSMIGKEAGDSLLHGSSEAGRYKQVYGAIAQDKAAAAQAAGAGRELDRANSFYSQGVTKMEGVLQPYTKNGVTPEQAYSQFRSTILSSPSKAYDLRKSLSPEVRKMQTATLIDELGQANPGKQDAAGTVFSSETFLTNWNKLSPNSKVVMFSGFNKANNVRQDIETVARASELIRKKGGIYANPSGTGGAVAQMGVGGTALFGAVTGNVPLLASVVGSVAGANITARLLTNPKFVNWLASADKIVKPESARFHTQRLAVLANQIEDEETRNDLAAFMAALEE